jgi:hypothetical protein
MAQPRNLDEALSQLLQSFADVGVSLRVLADLRRRSDQLREPLKITLADLRTLIDHTIALL